MGLPNDLVFGPDGNLYVAKWDLGEVLRFNGSTGQFIDVFAAHPINSNSNFEPAGLAFGPNGNLYVGTGNTGSCPDSFCNAVLRYDGTTGSFIDIFVASGTGQLNDPWEIEFGPDGNLYARTSGDAILRFDGTTGDFIDRFAEGDPEFGDDFVGFDFGYDGNLYVANHSGEKGILRFDGITGEFIDVFIAGGLQLTLPLWIEFSSPPSPAVPTLTPRAIATLVALLGTVALWAVRRQRAVGI
jgi:glucose/arabinose dehydrogenase